MTRKSICSKQQDGNLELAIGLRGPAAQLAVEVPEAPTVRRLAARIFERFPAGSWFAHVRRGDALCECHHPCNVPGGPSFLWSATTGEALLPVLAARAEPGSLVFMATDEPRRETFAALAKSFRLKFESDFHLEEGRQAFPDPWDEFFTYAVSARVGQLFRESPGHRVLVADRAGDAGADVEVCHTATKELRKVDALRKFQLPLLQSYTSFQPLAPIWRRCEAELLRL
mmetsp:Transcript_104961/g.338475  ORF Transcript_104961/g.338475 Transcript_104961/m.338475 type:complete len:228 (-) Transcript_104961:122-805(-)